MNNTETTETTNTGTSTNMSTDLESLYASPIPGSRFNGWVRQHTAAVTAFLTDRGPRRSERAILSLLAGIDQYVGSNAEYIDPYMGQHVTGPMLDAVTDALNLDLGRLDGGTLSAWVGRMRARCGIDENGEWVGV